MPNNKQPAEESSCLITDRNSLRFFGPFFWCPFWVLFLVPDTLRGQMGVFVRLGWTVAKGICVV
jgi:hypothetical protein